MIEGLSPFGKVWSIADLSTLPPLALAYVGDAVFELFVRTELVDKGLTRTNKLHKSAVSMVKAKSQAEILHSIEDILTEEEKVIVRRGRNTKSPHMPKGATVAEYRLSTGFEALVGYLFLLGKYERLKVLLEKGCKPSNVQEPFIAKEQPKV